MFRRFAFRTRKLFPPPKISDGQEQPTFFCSGEVGHTRIISQQEVLGEGSGSYNGTSGHKQLYLEFPGSLLAGETAPCF